MLGSPIWGTQLRAGQTKALLTINTVREHLDSISPSAPLFSANWLQRPNLYTVSEKNKAVKKNNNFNVNKARYPSLGGIFYLSWLLTATVLRKQTVNNITIWRDWLWWSLWEWSTWYYHSSEVGSWNNHGLLAFSWKQYSLNRDNFIARPLNPKY